MDLPIDSKSSDFHVYSKGDILLKRLLDYYTKLGISLNNSNALKDFNLKRKPENIIVGLGVDVTHNFFKKNLFLDPLKSILLKNLNNNNTVKKISKIISNSGLSF